MGTLDRRKRIGLSRAVEMLLILQSGLCGRCGRARYSTRRTACHAARIAAPGKRLRAYRCGDAWHLSAPPGRPQVIDPPVTMPLVRQGRGLDLRGQDERRYRIRHRSQHDGDRSDRIGPGGKAAEPPAGPR